MLPLHKEFNGFRISKHEDVEFLAPKLRYADIKRNIRWCRTNTLSSIIKRICKSEICFTIVDKENVPVGMFGVIKLVQYGY